MKNKKNFVNILQSHAEAKAKEYEVLCHKYKEIDVQITRTRKYVDNLNQFLIENGQEPVSIPEESPTNAGEERK